MYFDDVFLPMELRGMCGGGVRTIEKQASDDTFPWGWALSHTELRDGGMEGWSEGWRASENF